MKHPFLGRLRGAVVAAVLLGLASGIGFAQAAKPAPAPEPTPAPPPPLEPAALERMKAMSDLLKTAGSFTFTTVTDREQPSVGGPMLDFFIVSKVTVTRPNQLRIESQGDRFGASLWYDGKTVAIHANKSKFYGQAPAPATIDEAVQMLMDRLNTPLPVAGFLLKDPYARMMEGVTTAFDAGTGEVDGVMCRHLAFSEGDADWQVWIEEGAKPLPRRIAVTYKKYPGSPRVMATLSDWNLAPTIPAGAFTFVPPAGTTKVDWKSGL